MQLREKKWKILLSGDEASEDEPVLGDKEETRAHATITFTAWGQPKIIINYGLPSQRSSSLVSLLQPRPQACARYPCVRRKLGTERHLDDFSWRVDGWCHIRNCRGQLATRLSPLSVGLFYPVMLYSHCLVQSFVLIGVPVNLPEHISALSLWQGNCP